ncbi:MAG TPA: methylated-DNA--[protein]-cysteine S-methyltransferase [Candidatus Cryptobacteroides sp.]|nr:methylated-DNA--[protein]-cysteine S-methyltransferase [Candidatus Cryptobacteroides sp.]
MVYYNSPVGKLILEAQDGWLTLCDWAERHADFTSAPCNVANPSIGGATESHEDIKIISLTIKQLEEYFDGRRKTFDIPLNLVGTEFQKTVWKQLLHIPYAKTESYAAIAKAIGRPSAVRAVAGAIGANPISIIVPCHRVIGSDGSLIGYAGGLEAKKYLLTIERAFI